MKPRIIMTTIFLIFTVSLRTFASTDGIYSLNKKLNYSWDGTNASLIAATSADYDYAYGDEANVTYTFPQSWPSFTFYGQTYAQITADTNGNIWFGTLGNSNSFVLSTTGPVISAWNNDLSSYFNGGVFVQHKTDLPLGERIVIEWQAETYTDAGTTLPSNFEVVLFKNGDIRVDYKSVGAVNAKDSGSGISNNDGPNNPHFLSITSTYFPVYQLAGNSYGFTTSISNLHVTFNGTGGGIITSVPDGIACNTNCSATFPTGELVMLTPAPVQYSYFAGWSNVGCTGVGDCVFSITGNPTVTATFELEASKRSGTFYPSVQVAYNNALSGDTIYAWDYQFSDGLLCDQDRVVTILGGYDPIYSTVTGTSKLTNTFIIKAGTVRVKNLAVVGSESAAPMIMTTTLAATDPTTALTVTSISGPALIERSATGCKTDCDEKDDDNDDQGKHRNGHRDN